MTRIHVNVQYVDDSDNNSDIDSDCDRVNDSDSNKRVTANGNHMIISQK